MEILRTGYQGFGSFHTENVQELVSIPAEAYSPPPLPFSLDDIWAEYGDLSTMPLGLAGRNDTLRSQKSRFERSQRDTAPHSCSALAARKLFLIDFGDWTFVNHGAFGGTAAVPLAESDRWRRHAERQPLRFIDRELFYQVVRVIREAAAWVHCAPRDLVLTPNATTGLNAVIRSVIKGPEDGCYMLGIGYGSVKKMFQLLAEEVGAPLTIAEVSLPANNEEILALVDRTLPRGTRLACFDAVTSNTAVMLPIRRAGVFFAVPPPPLLRQTDLHRPDLQGAGGSLPLEGRAGADRRGTRPGHAPGGPAAAGEKRPLSRKVQARSYPQCSCVGMQDADYFVSNCHKWLNAPRGSALLYCRRELQGAIQPPIISHGIGAGFTSDFIWDGCRDYSSMLAVSSSIELLRRLGPERVYRYQRDLLAQATTLLTTRWGTRTLVPLDQCGAMALVLLPRRTWPADRAEASSTDAKYVQDMLHFGHRIECPVKCIQGNLYVRISAHTYNVLEDYERLAAAIVGMPPAG